MFKVCPKCGSKVLAEYFEKHVKYCVELLPPLVEKYGFTIDEQRKVREEMYEPTLVGREWGCFLKLVDSTLRKNKPRMGYRDQIEFKYPPDPNVVGKLHYHPAYVSFSIKDVASAIVFSQYEALGERRWF